MDHQVDVRFDMMLLSFLLLWSYQVAAIFSAIAVEIVVELAVYRCFCSFYKVQSIAPHDKALHYSEHSA